MMTMKNSVLPVFLLVVAGFVGLVVLISVVFYNRFVRFKHKISGAWSDIDVQLKRRYDLIPNLVETVKGYAAHETGVFEAIAKSRSLAISASDVPSQAMAERNLSGAMRQMFAVAESYPDLKADNNFKALQESLISTEDHIQQSRRYYNALVRDNNVAVEAFPGVLFARLFGFGAYEFFELESEAEAQNISVKFS